MWIRIRNLFNPGSGMEQIWIRDKHPGSATLTSRSHKDEILATPRLTNTVSSIPFKTNLFRVHCFPLAGDKAGGFRRRRSGRRRRVCRRRRLGRTAQRLPVQTLLTPTISCCCRCCWSISWAKRWNKHKRRERESTDKRIASERQLKYLLLRGLDSG